MPGSIDAIVSPPLLRRIRLDDGALHRVVFEVSPAHTTTAYAQLETLIREALKEGERTDQHIISAGSDTRAFKARLQGKVILQVVTADSIGPQPVITTVLSDRDEGRVFNPDDLVRSVIALPLLDEIEAAEERVHSVLIELNTSYVLGQAKAKQHVLELIDLAISSDGESQGEQEVSSWKNEKNEQYVFAKLTGRVIRKLVEMDQTTPAVGVRPVGNRGSAHAIYHVWPDFRVRAQIWESCSTVKADACLRAFATTGKGIVWAVLDSGIAKHPHFEKYDNLELPNGLHHMDFTGPGSPTPVLVADLADKYGHGTHVAGIIAGELGPTYSARAMFRERDEKGCISHKGQAVEGTVRGIAPQCTLLSYKVLDDCGEGDSSTVIAAIQKIQELNGYGRHILVHGVNLSMGHDFDPEWFACGQSPLCVEVDRLVNSGVAVVIAAGNTGRGFALTINDPGNAELAITVGATHRNMPHRFGVSYFSSKGPTGDGRRKPDLLAPGENILSCGAGLDLETYKRKAGQETPAPNGTTWAYYLERSGTSMAAPHVSGILAGILSARAEFIGLPLDLKEVLVKNATDLGREPSFQGGGLVDMMRAIQAV